MGASISPGQCLGSEVDRNDAEESSSDEEEESSRETADPSTANTVILWDWDDTLLCSTAIHNQTWRWPEVRKLERDVKRTLRTSMRLGRTLIVTNGNATWVEDSARLFMPGLLPLLSRLTVVSARARFESVHPGDPFLWKRAAFEDLLTSAGGLPADAWLNLVVLGDQYPEIDAAHFIAAKRGENATSLKVVKFQDQPSVVELASQLRRVTCDLRSLVEAEDDRSRGVVCRHLPAEVEGDYVTDDDDHSLLLDCRRVNCRAVDPVAELKDIWQMLA